MYVQFFDCKCNYLTIMLSAGNDYALGYDRHRRYACMYVYYCNHCLC
jgi:hypothetical protein